MQRRRYKSIKFVQSYAVFVESLHCWVLLASWWVAGGGRSETIRGCCNHPTILVVDTMGHKLAIFSS